MQKRIVTALIVAARLIVAASALGAAEIPPDAKTFALVIGIAKYQKLPQDLWLQYPDADATALSRHLASARGGGVPADQMLVLTNEQATTAALRSAFQTFLKTRPGRNDTVYILIAGHGTVDSSGAYILTWDSDPENLAGTALPMAELHSVVEESLSKVGHVILLADVCRAAAIAGQKTTALGGAVEQIGEAPGELLGLMAARPREVSLEGTRVRRGPRRFYLVRIEGS